MARGDQLGRQWKIIQTLTTAQRGKSVADLAMELECHPRTVYRDLEALELAGFPVYTDWKNGKNFWFLLDTAKNSIPIPLNLTELMALYFSRDMLKILKDTVFYDALKSLFTKIKTTLPPEYINYLEQLEQNLHVGFSPYKKYGEFRKKISRVNEAISSRHYIEIEYFTMSRKQKSQRRVAPYKIWFFDGTFYLIGFCCLRGDVRIFALDRIKTLEQTSLQFEIPEDFNIETFMQSSFGIFTGKPVTVKIHFSADIAGYIREKTWHASQEIDTREDGSIVFTARVAGTDEIKFWILRWGGKARVIEPESLRNEIKAEAKAILKNYRTSGNVKLL